MKRILIILLIIILAAFFIFSGCKIEFDFDDDDDTLAFANEWGNFIKDKDDDFLIYDSAEEIRASWFSYLELNPDKISEQSKYEAYLDGVFKNLKTLSVNTLFVQVRAFCDAIYPTDNFESSSCVVKARSDKLPFDFLEVIINKAAEYEMQVHAWINPYRIVTSIRNETVSPDSRLGKLIAENAGDVIKTDSGTYLNPASLKAQQLVIDGVRELFENYKICGIHLDDYFYPTTDKSFDNSSYRSYKKSGGKLSLDDWRRENVNNLISGIYSAAKSYSENAVVSISPSADIAKNYSTLYADVEKWCGEEGFADWIMPQIYFGFENQTMPFERVALSWKELCKERTVKICPGLALYKVGTDDVFAGTGADEWKENNDIISRQVKFLKENDFDGFCLFSSKFVNFNKNVMKKELKNLCDVL